MALYTTQSITDNGVTATYGAVTSSDTFVPGLHTFLHVKNGGASSITVTLPIPITVDGQAVTSRTATIGAGLDMMFAIPATVYSTSGGTGTVTYSATTSVTAAVLIV